MFQNSKDTVKSKTFFTLSLEIILGILICLISLFLFLKIGNEILENEILKFDSFISNLIYTYRSPNTTDFMLFITFLGSGLILVFISVIMIIFISKYRKKDAFIFSAILISAIILNFLLKIIYQRPRPDYLPIIHEKTLSFPSGHAMNSFVFYAAISYFVYRETKNTKLAIIITIISLVIIFLIGISRIYLGVHYPSDVIGGWIAGFFWFISAIIFEKIVIAKRIKIKTNK